MAMAQKQRDEQVAFAEKQRLDEISRDHRSIRLDEIREHASQVDRQRAEAHDRRRQQRLSSHLKMPQYDVNINFYRDRLDNINLSSPESRRITGSPKKILAMSENNRAQLAKK